MRDRDILHRNLIRVDDKSKKQLTDVKVHEHASAAATEECDELKVMLASVMTQAKDLDKQREKNGIMLSLSQAKTAAAMEELKNRDNKIGEYKKNLTDVEEKIHFY